MMDSSREAGHDILDNVDLATLVEPDDLDDLARAWRHFEERATCHGGVGVTVRADALPEARRRVGQLR